MFSFDSKFNLKKKKKVTKTMKLCVRWGNEEKGGGVVPDSSLSATLLACVRIERHQAVHR